LQWEPRRGTGSPDRWRRSHDEFLPLILMFAIFYFLLIRPQQKKAKEHRAMLESLKVGDNVKTASGLHGRIAALDDQVVTLEIATGIKVKIDKPFITMVEKRA